MRIKHKVNVVISDDADGEEVLFGPNDTNAEFVIDGYQRMASGKLQIAAASSEDVPFGDVDAVKGVYLRIIGGDVELRFNGEPTGIQLKRAKTGSTDPVKFFVEAEFNQVQIVTTDDAVAGIYCVWGDPTV